MKDALGLSREISVFRMTTDIIGLEPDEVTVRIRSVLELMGFLALGVEVPPEHVEENRATRAVDTADGGDRPLVPLRVRFQAEPPADAFVAVRHGEHWFYIPHSDQQSKQSFGLLAYLFQMQAPKLQGAGPLLTVTTG